MSLTSDVVLAALVSFALFLLVAAVFVSCSTISTVFFR